MAVDDAIVAIATVRSSPRHGTTINAKDPTGVTKLSLLPAFTAASSPLLTLTEEAPFYLCWLAEGGNSPDRGVSDRAELSGTLIEKVPSLQFVAFVTFGRLNTGGPSLVYPRPRASTSADALLQEVRLPLLRFLDQFDSRSATRDAMDRARETARAVAVNQSRKITGYGKLRENPARS